MSELMMKMTLDVSVALMLVLTIYYCIKLNKRIKVLQDSKSELAQLIKQFDESTQQATDSIIEIQRASKKISTNIQEKLDKANYIADDLAFMIERGNKTADKMDSRITGGRATRAANEDNAATRAKAERAVRSARRPRSDATRASTTDGNSDKKNGGIEAMMERISELKSGQADTKKPSRQMARMRTKSERDLMDAMKDKKQG